jgi:hypothetical protein
MTEFASFDAWHKNHGCTKHELWLIQNCIGALFGFDHPVAIDASKALRDARDNTQDIPQEIRVRLVVDGDMWMALVGRNLQDGCGAFAKTPKEALRKLSEHEEFDFWAFGLYDCDECGNEFKPKDKDNHICTSCHTLTARL